jgi:hypothetical protein
MCGWRCQTLASKLLEGGWFTSSISWARFVLGLLHSNPYVLGSTSGEAGRMRSNTTQEPERFAGGLARGGRCGRCE